MANLYPLQDCLQIPLDEDFNRILLYVYVYNPTPLTDPFKEKMRREELEEHITPDEFPMYLNIELWEWQDDNYIKKETSEELISIDIAKIITKRYLRFIIQAQKEYIDYNRKYPLLSRTPYYNIGIGCRWNRGWARDIGVTGEKSRN